MGSAPESWSTQQLAEFLALVSSFDDERSALGRAVERVAEVLDAEVAAAMQGGSALASVGFPTGETPEAELGAVAAGRRDVIDVGGAGSCGAVSVPLEEGGGLHLVVARSPDAPLERDELDLLRGMGRVLGAAVRTLRLLEAERSLRERSQRQARENARLLAALRDRQVLVERLSALERAVVGRSPLHAVLDAVTADARELIGDDAAALRLIDPDDRAMTRIAAAAGADEELLTRFRRSPTEAGLGARAMAEEGLVRGGRGTAVRTEIDLATDGIVAGLATPVHQDGRVAGSLAVGSRDPGRVYGMREEEMLLAFAEHASLALDHGKALEDAVHEAVHDSLTGLPNRALFLDRLEHAIARSSRTGHPVAVLFFDLDGFKAVNDSLGHAAGDRLLVAVSDRLVRWLRPSDTVARFGGDEFAVLLDEIGDSDDARRAADRMLQALGEPFELEGREVAVTASIGVAAGQGKVDELLRDADLAMYRAKAKGKARYEVFEPGMHKQVVSRLELEVDLRRAVERGELVLHYQPIIDLSGDRIAGLEALVRWRHPRKGLIKPREFIPMAEQSGEIVPVGRWVLREACRQAALWRAKYPAYRSLFMSANISAAQLREPGLLEEVGAALRLAQLEPEHLMLEMTETVLMDDSEANVARLEDLRALGVRVAMDDFGTGYSSLHYLDRFPIDTLKIAKVFVDRLGDPEGEPAIARAMAYLAEIFALDMIAEGVEGGGQRERLLELGCRLGQGHFFFAPLAPEEADALLLRAGLATIDPGVEDREIQLRPRRD